VTLPDAETMECLREYSGDLIVGDLRCGELVMNIPLGLDGDSLAHHLGVFATTGMGKSNLMKVLASAIMQSGEYGLLIFDPHGEYHDGGKAGDRQGLTDHPLADRLLFSYAKRRLKGKYNNLTIPVAEIEIDDISQIMSFSQAQHEALHAVRYKFGAEWLEKLMSSEIETLAEELSTGSLTFHESTLGVLLRRAEWIKNFRSIVRDTSVSTITDIVGKLQKGFTVLVDTANLSQAEETMVTSVITRAVLNSYRNKYQSGGDFERLSPCLIMLEEAQRVLGSSEGDTNVFYKVVREGRKFKVGLGVITQQPKLLSEELLSQLNSMFILGLADERDRSIVKSSAKQDISALGTEIQTLAAGETLLTSPTVPCALPIKIYLYEDYLRNLVVEEIKENPKITDSFFD
jgi:DNA helicase HerA-like ATPase